MVENLVKWQDVREVEMLPGIYRRTLSVTDSMMICEFRINKGAVVPPHSHPHEQVGYLVTGCMEVTIDGKLFVLGPGDGYAVSGGVEHSATYPVNTILIDCFSPPREEYR